MRARALSLLVAVAAASLLAPAAYASDTTSCKLPEGLDPLADRAELLAEFERLPKQCLETLFRECSAASERTFLDLGSVAVCSFGYEALLRQGFGGNFHALLAWWRSEKSTATVQ